jgi:hypothetical protein
LEEQVSVGAWMGQIELVSYFEILDREWGSTPIVLFRNLSLKDKSLRLMTTRALLEIDGTGLTKQCLLASHSRATVERPLDILDAAVPAK